MHPYRPAWNNPTEVDVAFEQMAAHIRHGNFAPARQMN